MQDFLIKRGGTMREQDMLTNEVEEKKKEK